MPDTVAFTRGGIAAVALLGVALSGTVQAEPSHGIAMHGAPKYDASFTALDYANPGAPKQGTLRLADERGIGTRNLTNIEVAGSRIQDVAFPFRV